MNTMSNLTLSESAFWPSGMEFLPTNQQVLNRSHCAVAGSKNRTMSTSAMTTMMKRGKKKTAPTPEQDSQDGKTCGPITIQPD
jgi:hypothetical protein